MSIEVARGRVPRRGTCTQRMSSTSRSMSSWSPQAASGLPAALFPGWLDNEVLLLEKAPKLGGIGNKAAFWYWVPNNERPAGRPTRR